jgi:hypothetical protein
MDRNLKLNSTAHQVGVKRFGLFHGAGIQAMYETRLAEIKVRRDIGEKEDWLDRQGVEDRSLSAIWRTCLLPGPYRPSCRVLGRFVLTVIGEEGFFNLPRRDPHDVDGVADHVRGSALAFGASGHYCPR